MSEAIEDLKVARMNCDQLVNKLEAQEEKIDLLNKELADVKQQAADQKVNIFSTAIKGRVTKLEENYELAPLTLMLLVANMTRVGNRLQFHDR